MTEPQTPEEWVAFFHGQYTNTKNPVHVLQAFCHLAAGKRGTVIVPKWIATVLGDGLNDYLTGLMSGRSLSLEAAMGIRQSETIERTSLDKMVDYVHLYRWLFDLKQGNAVQAVYRRYERDIISMGLRLDHQGVTRDGASFKQFYDRQCKKGYAAWVATADKNELTELNRQEALAYLDEDTARFIRVNSPYYKTQ